MSTMTRKLPTMTPTSIRYGIAVLPGRELRASPSPRRPPAGAAARQSARGDEGSRIDPKMAGGRESARSR